jgi:hypothetical protein
MMMKKLLAALLLVIIGAVYANAQIYDPVKWETTFENVIENEATVVITAIIAPGWHLYSQFIEKGGPNPTSFKFDEGQGYQLNSQPYYVIVDHDSEALVPSKAFDLDIENYAGFLRSGMEAYNENNN